MRTARTENAWSTFVAVALFLVMAATWAFIPPTVIRNAWIAERAVRLDRGEPAPPGAAGAGPVSNSDPVTGQAAWYDVRVRIYKAGAREAEQSWPQVAAVAALPGMDRVRKTTHCSALVKVNGDLTQLFFSHAETPLDGTKCSTRLLGTCGSRRLCFSSLADPLELGTNQ
mgnify:CR=1 FL=1